MIQPQFLVYLDLFICKFLCNKMKFIFREALPRLDNYRLSLRAFKRPSISLLHGEVLEHISVSKPDRKEQIL